MSSNPKSSRTPKSILFYIPYSGQLEVYLRFAHCRPNHGLLTWLKVKLAAIAMLPRRRQDQDDFLWTRLHRRIGNRILVSMEMPRGFLLSLALSLMLRSTDRVGSLHEALSPIARLKPATFDCATHAP